MRPDATSTSPRPPTLQAATDMPDVSAQTDTDMQTATPDSNHNIDMRIANLDAAIAELY